MHNDTVDNEGEDYEDDNGKRDHAHGGSNLPDGKFLSIQSKSIRGTDRLSVLCCKKENVHFTVGNAENGR